MHHSFLLGHTMSSSVPVPSFHIQSSDGKARVGVLRTTHGEMQTPAALLYTRRGNPMNLTPDMLERMQPSVQGVQINVMQFMSGPTPATLANHRHGAHGYLALPPTTPVIATQRDPMIYEYGAKPSSDGWTYATIHTGGVMVTPDMYMQAVKALQPDLWVTLCDEVPGDARLKRVKVSVDRTIKWLDACLSSASGSDITPTTDSDVAWSGSSSVIAIVPGAGILSERVRAAQAIADKPVAGFALGGFGTGEPPEERPALIQAVLQYLPSDKPRLISGMGTPMEVLEGVAEGLDLFDNSYVLQASSLGYALSFPTSLPQGKGDATPTPGGESDPGTDGTKINLWSMTYRSDKGPLVHGCKCYTCSKHSRSYIHHLLQANEMLADVLLEVHNTHHNHLFMEGVRHAVQEGKLAQYMSWFQGLKGLTNTHMPPPATNTTATKRWHPQDDLPEGEAGGGETVKRQKTED